MTTTNERAIPTDAVRLPTVRQHFGNLGPLGADINRSGLHRPITLWKDGTLISGARRHRAHLMASSLHILAVFVDTIEDAAKQLLGDLQDDRMALPMTSVEMCRLWSLLRELDAPAARLRAADARRRGVELRRQTADGTRSPGRAASRTEDYLLSVVAPVFGMSETTAKRLWAIYSLAYLKTDDERTSQARDALDDIDRGEVSISAAYASLISGRSRAARFPAVTPVATSPVDVPKQLATWEKSLPQLEGLTAGLVGLGPIDPSLPWDQVAPIHTRLMAVRRDLEKMIKQMRENNKS